MSSGIVSAVNQGVVGANDTLVVPKSPVVDGNLLGKFAGEGTKRLFLNVVKAIFLAFLIIFIGYIGWGFIKYFASDESKKKELVNINKEEKEKESDGNKYNSSDANRIDKNDNKNGNVNNDEKDWENKVDDKEKSYFTDSISIIKEELDNEEFNINENSYSSDSEDSVLEELFETLRGRNQKKKNKNNNGIKNENNVENNDKTNKKENKEGNDKTEIKDNNSNEKNIDKKEGMSLSEVFCLDKVEKKDRLEMSPSWQNFERFNTRNICKISIEELKKICGFEFSLYIVESSDGDYRQEFKEIDQVGKLSEKISQAYGENEKEVKIRINHVCTDGRLALVLLSKNNESLYDFYTKYATDDVKIEYLADYLSKKCVPYETPVSKALCYPEFFEYEHIKSEDFEKIFECFIGTSLTMQIKEFRLIQSIPYFEDYEHDYGLGEEIKIKFSSVKDTRFQFDVLDKNGKALFSGETKRVIDDLNTIEELYTHLDKKVVEEKNNENNGNNVVNAN